MSRSSDTDDDVNELRRKKFPPLYDLTQYTGKNAHADRGGALFGFIEYSRRHRTIFLVALMPSIAVTALLAPFAGSMAIFGFVITQAVAFFLMEARSRKGLKLRMYQTVYDKQTSIDGMLILCGKPVAPENLNPGWVVFSNTPVGADRPAVVMGQPADADDDDLAVYSIGTDDEPVGEHARLPRRGAPLRGRRVQTDHVPEPVPLADLLPNDRGETTLV